MAEPDRFKILAFQYAFRTVSNSIQRSPGGSEYRNDYITYLIGQRPGRAIWPDLFPSDQ